MRQLVIVLIVSVFLTPLATSAKAAPLTTAVVHAKASRKGKPHKPGRIRPRVKGKPKRGASPRNCRVTRNSRC